MVFALTLKFNSSTLIDYDGVMHVIQKPTHNIEPTVICLYLLNKPNSMVEYQLQGEFKVVKVNSLAELKSVLKKYVIFALLVEGSVHSLDTLVELRKIIAYCPKIKHNFYGKVSDEELAFKL